MTSQSTIPDPLTLHQLWAAQDSAKAAWAAVRVYQQTLIATAVGLVFSALISLVAIRGPERERHTRDLEGRKRRARLEQRASLAGLRGLAVVRRLTTYIDAHPQAHEKSPDRLETYRRRLLTRKRVIGHFLALGLRDLNLVGWLYETCDILEDVRGGVVLEPVIGGMHCHTHDAERVYVSRKARLISLREHFQEYAREKRNKDASLQIDLDRVWSLLWLLQFWKTPETKRD